MKQLVKYAAVFVAIFMFVSTAKAAPGPDIVLQAPQTNSAVAWANFSDNLVRALKSENEGLKLAAVQRVIQYGSRVDVDKAVFEVVRLYRDHGDDNVRRMAVVALGQMQNDWAMDFLQRSERFEKSPIVLKTIKAVTHQSHLAAASM